MVACAPLTNPGTNLLNFLRRGSYPHDPKALRDQLELFCRCKLVLNANILIGLHWSVVAEDYQDGLVLKEGHTFGNLLLGNKNVWLELFQQKVLKRSKQQLLKVYSMLRNLYCSRIFPIETQQYLTTTTQTNLVILASFSCCVCPNK